MKRFEVVSIQNGRREITYISAAEPNDALTTARETMDGTVISITQKSQNALDLLMSKIPRPIDTKELLFVSMQISTMTNAGIPLMEALIQCEAMIENTRLKNCFSQIISDINSGSGFSSTIKTHKSILGSEFVAMAELGEQTGDLAGSFDQLSTILARKDEINKKLIRSITYPSLTLIVSILAFVIIISVVVPKFEMIFERFHLELPFFTRALLTFAGFCSEYGVWVVLFVACLIIALYHFYTHDNSIRLKMDRLALKIPQLGHIISLSSAGRFAMILGSLNGAGITIFKSLEIARDSIQNSYIKSQVDKSIEKIQEGCELTPSMRESGLFDSLSLGLINSAEQSGTIAEVFTKVSRYYEQKFDTRVAFLTTILEPMMVMVVGCVVLVLAIGIFVPLWDMTGMARR